jgi:hypothetical protein
MLQSTSQNNNYHSDRAGLKRLCNRYMGNVILALEHLVMHLQTYAIIESTNMRTSTKRSFENVNAIK